MSYVATFDPLERWSSQTRAAGAKAIERERRLRAAQARRGVEPLHDLSIAEDARGPRGNLPTGDIAATKERRQ